MITNFEKITAELDEDEMKMIPIFVEGFQRFSIDNPITAPKIVAFFNGKPHAGIKKKLTEPRLRKIVNYIRSCGMLPLIATSEGYYVSHDPQVVRDQIRSLMERAKSIARCADGLKKFTKVSQGEFEL